MVSGFESKIYEVFWREKIVQFANGFRPSKSEFMLDFELDPVQKLRIFFLFGNPT